jgi:Pyridoxamine 5'-phosphate oxidase
MEAPRSAQRRKADTMRRLTSDVDAWIATADAEGNSYMLPLSFYWDGTGMIISTPRTSITARNLLRGGRIRVGLGQMRDVTMIDGTAEPAGDEATKDAFADKQGWDPRKDAGDYAWFRIVPDRMQAWREVNELPGRTLMREGRWLV